jgi:predicted tellurium resistance membrane protein TerC
MMMFGHKIQELLYSAPTLETVALVVLHAVGWISMLEGTGVSVPETYLFVAVAFATVIEIINLKLLRTQTKPAKNYCSSSTQPNRSQQSGRAKNPRAPRGEQLPLTR